MNELHEKEMTCYYCGSRFEGTFKMSKRQKSDRHCVRCTADYNRLKRSRKIKSMYGIGWDVCESIYAAQSSRCAICRKPIAMFTSKEERREMMRVDHDHETGEVRGLLCDCCNTGIGMLKDDINTLRAAIRYLESPPAFPIAYPRRYRMNQNETN